MLPLGGFAGQQRFWAEDEGPGTAIAAAGTADLRASRACTAHKPLMQLGCTPVYPSINPPTVREPARLAFVCCGRSLQSIQGCSEQYLVMPC